MLGGESILLRERVSLSTRGEETDTSLATVCKYIKASSS